LNKTYSFIPNSSAKKSTADEAMMQYQALENHDLKFIVYDLAGQMEYSTLHQFLTSNTNTIYLLVFDASLQIEEQKQNISYWISYLKSNLDFEQLNKEFSIIAVGTKMQKKIATTV
jgi:GTPase SAR1 family protein